MQDTQPITQAQADRLDTLAKEAQRGKSLIFLYGKLTPDGKGKVCNIYGLEILFRLESGACNWVIL